jgi:chorismate mutase
MVAVNGIQAQDVASAIFTATPDLNAAFPAQAAREIGWHDVPLLSAQEIPVPGALPRTIRILLHWNTGVSPQHIRHIYINGAETLRPDLAARQEEKERS